MGRRRFPQFRRGRGRSAESLMWPNTMDAAAMQTNRSMFKNSKNSSGRRSCRSQRLAQFTQAGRPITRGVARGHGGPVRPQKVLCGRAYGRSQPERDPEGDAVLWLRAVRLAVPIKPKPDEAIARSLQLPGRWVTEVLRARLPSEPRTVRVIHRAFADSAREIYRPDCSRKSRGARQLAPDPKSREIVPASHGRRATFAGRCRMDPVWRHTG